MGSKLYGRVRFGQYVLLRTAMPTARLAIEFGMQYKSTVETTMNICIIAKWIFSCLYIKNCKTTKLQEVHERFVFCKQCALGHRS